MAIEKETLRAMIRDFHGFDISDEELELVQPALDNYLAQVKNSGNWTCPALCHPACCGQMKGVNSDGRF